jgi:hypothetical protein
MPLFSILGFVVFLSSDKVAGGLISFFSPPPRCRWLHAAWCFTSSNFTWKKLIHFVSSQIAINFDFKQIIHRQMIDPTSRPTALPVPCYFSLCLFFFSRPFCTPNWTESLRSVSVLPRPPFCDALHYAAFTPLFPSVTAQSVTSFKRSVSLKASSVNESI